MNGLIISPNAVKLRMGGFGKPEQDIPPIPIATDGQGRMILSPELDLQVQSNGLDIRPLVESSDSVTATASNLFIRGLDGVQDSLSFNREASVAANQTSSVPILSTVYFLPTDTGAYRQNTFYVRNTGLVSVAVTVTLEIAPVNDSAYYVTDSSSFSLVGGNTLVLSPTRLMRYARVRVSALLSLATVTVYYFGRA